MALPKHAKDAYEKLVRKHPAVARGLEVAVLMHAVEFHYDLKRNNGLISFDADIRCVTRL